MIVGCGFPLPMAAYHLAGRMGALLLYNVERKSSEARRKGHSEFCPRKRRGSPHLAARGNAASLSRHTILEQRFALLRPSALRTTDCSDAAAPTAEIGQAPSMGLPVDRRDLR